MLRPSWFSWPFKIVFFFMTLSNAANRRLSLAVAAYLVALILPSI